MWTKLNVFFSKIITNIKLPFLLFLRFLSLCLQPERFQLHTKSKGSWVVSHTASSTKVRINGYFTTHLSPSSFLRVLSSSCFVADMMLYNQNFVAVCACEFACVMSHRMNKDCILIIPPPFRDASSPAQGPNTPHEEQLISCTDFFSLPQCQGRGAVLSDLACYPEPRNILSESFHSQLAWTAGLWMSASNILQHVKSTDVSLVVLFNLLQISESRSLNPWFSIPLSWRYSKELESPCLWSKVLYYSEQEKIEGGKKTQKRAGDI